MRRAAVATLLLALVLAPAGASRPRQTCPRDPALGSVAFVRAGALHVLELGSCRDRVLVPHGASRPRFSADGRFVAYGRGWVVPAGGGTPTRPLDADDVVWAPRGHTLAGVTERGGVALGGPDIAPRRLVPDGSNAEHLVWRPDGAELAFVRPHVGEPERPTKEIWLVDVAGGRAQRIAGLFPRPQSPALVGFSPDGAWLLWLSIYEPSVSSNLDGVPLLAMHVADGAIATVTPELLSRDYLSWCGNRLVAAVGADRYTTHGKRIALAAPPRWRLASLSDDPSRSWISPACSPDGRSVAASAGRSWVERRFGLEHRSIWLLSSGGEVRRRLTSPPAGATDELPRWDRDGRSILFVRTTPFGSFLNARGALYVVRRAGTLVGPIADLGTTGNYYGQYGWTDQLDWYQ